MSERAEMSWIFSCKNCQCYRYYCKCKQFISNDPEAYKSYFEESDNDKHTVCDELHDNDDPASANYTGIDPIFNLKK